MKQWEAMLDELCRRRDPMAWYDPKGRLRELAAMYEGMVECQQRGFAAPAGRRRLDMAVDLLWLPTAAGRAYWTKHNLGKARRPAVADELSPISRFSLAQRTVARCSVREVWDLPREPWTWSMRSEQRVEFGQATKVKPKVLPPADHWRAPW